MKKIVTIGLCAALVAGSIQQVRAHYILYLCIAGGAAIIGGVTTFMVKSCRPKYYCMTDEDGNRFYSNATRTEREVNGWTVTAGPYNSPEEAAAGCVVSKASLTSSITMAGLMTAQYSGAQNAQDLVEIPLRTITIEKSTDLKTWAVADRILDDPTNFSWYDTNGISSASQAFYRVSSN